MQEGKTPVTNGQLLLKYLVRQPLTPTELPPVIILLHGVGGNEKNLFQYAAMLPPEYLVIAARAPFVKGPDGYAWFGVSFATGKPVINPKEAEESRVILRQFIGQVVERYNADATNIYLAGFSQGGIMCYSVALTWPGLIKGMAALSGRVLPEIKPLVEASEMLPGLKVLISHGMEDNKLVVQYARDAREYIESLHILLTYLEWPGTGHVVTKEMMKRVVAWITG